MSGCRLFLGELRMSRTKRAGRRNGAESDWPLSVSVDGTELVESDNGTHPVHESVATPGRLGELAAAARELADGIEAANDALLSSVELGADRFWMSLTSAVEACRTAATELERTAGELVRAAAEADKACSVSWGVCPDHGVVVLSSGDMLTCRVLGCYRTPQASTAPCTRPVAYRVVDAAGSAFLACTGHAIACRRELVGAVITLTADSLEHL